MVARCIIDRATISLFVGTVKFCKVIIYFRDSLIGRDPELTPKF